MYALIIILSLNGYSISQEALPFPYISKDTCESAAEEFLNDQRTNATQVAVCVPIDTQMNMLGGLVYSKD